MIRTKCRLKTLTPCHTGSGNILLNNQDFIVDGYQIGIIEPRKIFNIVGEQGIDLWCRAINDNENIYTHLRRMNDKIRLKDFCRRTMSLYGETSNVAELREQLRSGKTACIPGSSLKGAIVTALMSSKSYDTDELLANIRPANNRIVDRVFSSAPQYDPKNSELRFLRVGDACFDQVPTCAFHCVSLNIRSGRSPLLDEKVHQLVECIYAEDTVEFTIDLPDSSSRYFQDITAYGPKIPHALTSPRALLRCINDHTKSLLEEELDFWQDYDNMELDNYLPQIEEMMDECNACTDGRSAIMRVGYGCGWNFITGAWSRRCTENDDPDRWQDILELARKDRKRRYDEYPFIKTRRIFYDGPKEPIMPFGFVKIEIEE